MTITTKDEKLSSKEAAEALGLAEQTLRIWRFQGAGPRSFKVGGRVFYLRRDLDEWLDAQYHAAALVGGAA